MENEENSVSVDVFLTKNTYKEKGVCLKLVDKRGDVKFIPHEKLRIDFTTTDGKTVSVIGTVYGDCRGVYITGNDVKKAKLPSVKKGGPKLQTTVVFWRNHV